MNIAFFIAILLFATTIISLGIWVFQDAKKIGFNNYQWTFIAVLAPIFLGVYFYLNKRKKSRNVVCPKCKKHTPVLSEKCINCNKPLLSYKEIDQGNSRKYLLVFLASFILWFLYFIIIVAGLV